jgi:hypothetical protein
MKVKIGNKIFDAKDEPLMIILEESEKQLISSMSKDDKKFCVYPDSISTDQIKIFMSEES